MAQVGNGLSVEIPIKVPIPERLLMIEDQETRSAAMREWWTAYATRYADYKAQWKDNQFVYMVKRGGE